MRKINLLGIFLFMGLWFASVDGFTTESKAHSDVKRYYQEYAEAVCDLKNSSAQYSAICVQAAKSFIVAYPPSYTVRYQAGLLITVCTTMNMDNTKAFLLNAGVKDSYHWKIARQDCFENGLNYSLFPEMSEILKRMREFNRSKYTQYSPENGNYGDRDAYVKRWHIAGMAPRYYEFYQLQLDALRTGKTHK
ncbi:MAG: hypothetical protein COT74_05330 [Bdellovibrionales bacterium CG10_big_fil_rev_8_21_14_0_10_45_34]|nr:MAG: hypothetical protein COT74_05330 [Bdellovibrionales bacterium CG10_big_fil_rev_8_21_14_0_10_45_34]